MEMKRENINAKNAPQPRGGYAQAGKLENFARQLFVSGPVPLTSADGLAEGVKAQARQAWLHAAAPLEAAGMDKGGIVKGTGFPADPPHTMENREIRAEYLGALTPAMTVVIAGIFDTAWLLEVEVIAAQ